MTQIRRLEDGTSMGVFSQIDFDNGEKVLLSFTSSEFAVFKVGFLGFTSKELFQCELSKWIKYLSSETRYWVDSFPGGKRSPLKESAKIALRANNIDELVDLYNNIVSKNT